MDRVIVTDVGREVLAAFVAGDPAHVIAADLGQPIGEVRQILASTCGFDVDSARALLDDRHAVNTEEADATFRRFAGEVARLRAALAEVAADRDRLASLMDSDETEWEVLVDEIEWEVLDQADQWWCLACGGRYREAYPEHGQDCGGQLEPVTVLVIRRPDG